MQKGDFINEYTTAANYKAVITCTGFVVGYRPEKSNYPTEELLDKEGNTSYCQSSKVFNTFELAEKFRLKCQHKHVYKLYTRIYELTTYTKI